VAMDLVGFTKKLIDIESVSGSEGEIGHFLASFLSERGYLVEMQPVAEGRFNVIAARGRHPRIFFSTHMDTVPPYIPFSSSEAHIYGRGACDAKGIIAAQIAAAERLQETHPDVVGLLFTVDEEVASLGARAANQHALASTCEFLINGEPTDNRLALGSKGSLRVRVSSSGRSAHSAYPESGISAIEALLDVLAGIRDATWPSDGFLGETTVNIGIIQGGTRSNVIPDKAHAELHFRIVASAAEVINKLDYIVNGRASLDVLSSSEPVVMRGLSGFETTIARFTTDISYLSNWGTPLLLGPGSILDAHTPEESVRISELTRAVDLYTRMATSLLEEKP
jgi:acetylornithine deacetylase